MVLLLLLSFLVVVVVYVWFKRRYAYWKNLGVPFPQPTLIVGNTGKAVTLQAPLIDILCNFYREYKGCSYVGIFNLWKPALLIRDPELVKDVLIKQFNNFHDNWIETEMEVDPPLAYNPFVQQNNGWKTIRAQLTPQFTSSKIKSMFPLIQKGCKNMTDFIKRKIENKKCNEFELKDLCSRFTGDNVISCAYGLDGKSFIMEHPDALKIGEQISSSSKVVQMKQTMGLFFPSLRRLFKTTFLGDPVPKMFWDIILEAIKYREENNIARNDFLDFLKELKTKSDIEVPKGLLVGHAFTFFLDGYETSSLTFAYALFELALSSDIQDIARREVEAVLEKHNGALTYESVHEMEYIDNIIFETLRKHPIIQFISRVCTEEIKFPPPRGAGTGEDVVIEKGTQTFLPVLGIHTDPEFYPDPERFDPDRFNEKNKNSRPKCSFLGFGDGPRVCLGRKFALEQIRLGLVFMLLNFGWKLNNKTDLPVVRETLHVFNSPKTDLWLDFYERS